MQAASSAKRTCSESRSTSLCTATVLIPISLHVQIMRQAISPRLAIRIFLNLRMLKAISYLPQIVCRKKAQKAQTNEFALFVRLCGLTMNSEKRLAVLNRLAVFDINLYYFTRRLRLDLVHQFHRLNDAHNRVRVNMTPDLY